MWIGNRWYSGSRGKAEQLERNLAITIGILGGDQPKKHAQKYGISQERVRQIVARVCRLANPGLYERMPNCKTFSLPWLCENKDQFVLAIYALCIAKAPNASGKPTTEAAKPL